MANDLGIEVQAGAEITGRILNDGDIVGGEAGVLIEGKADIRNDGLIRGGRDGVNIANGGVASSDIDNRGVIESESRAVNIGGSEASLENRGEILGLGEAPSMRKGRRTITRSTTAA